MSDFLTKLQLEFINGTIWRLLIPLEYHLGSPDGVETVCVPAGFITDFASIPRGLWNLLPPTGAYGKAAVLHDFLYQRRLIRIGVDGSRFCTRREADDILNEAMGVVGVGRLTRWTIYAGIRVGGWATWNQYRSEEA